MCECEWTFCIRENTRIEEDEARVKVLSFSVSLSLSPFSMSLSSSSSSSPLTVLSRLYRKTARTFLCFSVSVFSSHSRRLFTCPVPGQEKESSCTQLLELLTHKSLSINNKLNHAPVILYLLAVSLTRETGWAVLLELRWHFILTWTFSLSLSLFIGERGARGQKWERQKEAQERI